MDLFCWLKKTWHRLFGTRNRVEILIVENKEGFIQGSIRWFPENFPLNDRHGKPRDERITQEVAAVICSLVVGDLWPTIEQSLASKVESLRGTDYGLGLAIIRQYGTYRKNRGYITSGTGQSAAGAANPGDRQEPEQSERSERIRGDAPVVRPSDVFRQGE